MNEMKRIVVGVDGSAASKDALRWALSEARLRGSTVEAVNVWHYPALTYAPGIYSAPVFAHDELEGGARAELDAAVEAVMASGQTGLTGTEVPVVKLTVLEGSAVERLVERSEDAELLVVGNRGHGGFTSLLLGSVAHQCTLHAQCPVVVVRPGTHSHGVA